MHSIVQCVSILQNRITYVYAYTYKPVRLAVPLPWKVQLVSELQHLMTLEIPLTILSLIVLPWILSMRKHRSIFRASSILISAYHVLSGNDEQSLIRPSDQKTFILLICGLVSLVSQYPINLLKGEVIASPYEQRVHPSNCKVNSCEVVNQRHFWFDDTVDGLEKEFNIIRLGSKKISNQDQASVTEANLHKGCSLTSLSMSDMLNLTQLAFLVQYHTLCNDPELLKLQLTKFSGELVFEYFPHSAASQPLCFTSWSHSGHVLFNETFGISNQILEHDLLKYHHVNASLHPAHFHENRFWTMTKKEKGWGHPGPIKKKVESVMRTLRQKYGDFDMRGDQKDSFKTTLWGAQSTFVTFLGAALLLILGSVVCRLKSSNVRTRVRGRNEISRPAPLLFRRFRPR